MNFKDRLREEIEYQGLSGKEIAAKVGISYSTFLSYVDARSVLPNVETAVKIAQILGVSVEFLVNGKESGSEDFMKNERILVSNFKRMSDLNQKNLIKISQVLE